MVIPGHFRLRGGASPRRSSRIVDRDRRRRQQEVNRRQQAEIQRRREVGLDARFRAQLRADHEAQLEAQRLGDERYREYDEQRQTQRQAERAARPQHETRPRQVHFNQMQRRHEAERQATEKELEKVEQQLNKFQTALRKWCKQTDKIREEFDREDKAQQREQIERMNREDQSLPPLERVRRRKELRNRLESNRTQTWNPIAEEREDGRRNLTYDRPRLLGRQTELHARLKAFSEEQLQESTLLDQRLSVRDAVKRDVPALDLVPRTLLGLLSHEVINVHDNLLQYLNAEDRRLLSLAIPGKLKLDRIVNPNPVDRECGDHPLYPNLKSRHLTQLRQLTVDRHPHWEPDWAERELCSRPANLMGNLNICQGPEDHPDILIHEDRYVCEPCVQEAWEMLDIYRRPPTIDLCPACSLWFREVEDGLQPCTCLYDCGPQRKIGMPMVTEHFRPARITKRQPKERPSRQRHYCSQCRADLTFDAFYHLLQELRSGPNNLPMIHLPPPGEPPTLHAYLLAPDYIRGQSGCLCGITPGRKIRRHENIRIADNRDLCGPYVPMATMCLLCWGGRLPEMDLMLQTLP